MTLKKIKKMLALKDIKENNKKSGKFGENLARKWLEEEWDIIDVSSQDKPFFNQDELRENGAKRPDFVSILDYSENNQKIILWDAKFHVITNNSFTLKDDEIHKYTNLKNFFAKKIECEENDIFIIFIIYPKQNDGSKMYLASLDEFETGEITTLCNDSAKQITLNENNCYDTSLIQENEIELWIQKNMNL